MKKLIALTTLLTALAFAQDASRVLTGSAQPPLPFNILPQPGFESRTTGWSVNGGTFTTVSDTANVARGRFSGSWLLPASTSAGLILQSDNIAIPAGLYGRQCRGRLLYKGNASTNGSLVIEAYDGTTVYGQKSLTNSSTYNSLTTFTFTCPSSGGLRFRIRSTATSPSNPTLVYFDEVYLGEADSNITAIAVGDPVVGYSGSGFLYPDTNGNLAQSTLAINSSGGFDISGSNFTGFGLNTINGQTNGGDLTSNLESTLSLTGTTDSITWFSVYTAYPKMQATGTDGDLNGFYSYMDIQSASTNFEASGFLAETNVGSSKTVANLHSFVANIPANNGTITNYAGLRIKGVANGTVSGYNDAIHVDAGRSFFNGNVFIDGAADTVQLKLQGHSTQTSDIFAVEKSDATNLLKVTNVNGTAIRGTTTNDSAAAGYVGEWIEGLIAQASAITLTTATTADVTSISLTAGDWLVSGLCNFNAAVIVGTQSICAITSTSGNSLTGANRGENRAEIPTVPTVASDVSITIPQYHVKLSATTTYYLKAQSTFSSGTNKVNGRISAVRIR